MRTVSELTPPVTSTMLLRTRGVWRFIDPKRVPDSSNLDIKLSECTLVAWPILLVASNIVKNAEKAWMIFVTRLILEIGHDTTHHKYLWQIPNPTRSIPDQPDLGHPASNYEKHGLLLLELCALVVRSKPNHSS